MRDNAILIAGFLLGFGLGYVIAREQPVVRAQPVERPLVTRQWRVATVLSAPGGEFGELRVDVIDTAGVCLYVMRKSWSSEAASLVAVPKTQLPSGAGCQ